MDMIRKLRIRFVSIMMVVACLMLIIIFGLVIHMTHARIKDDSFRMMENVANAPIGTQNDRHPKRRADARDHDVQLPFFRVQVDADGSILSVDGNYYDLTQDGSEEILTELVQLVQSDENEVGEIRDYALRYYRTSSFSHPDGPDALVEGPDVAPEGAQEAADSLPDDAEASDNASESAVQSFDDPEHAQEASPQREGTEIIVFSDISSELAAMHNLYFTCMIIGLGSFLVFLILSIFFARWAVRPVEEAWTQQRQFVSDASHELKTPLTVILTDAEMLKSPRFDVVHKQQFIDNILTMSTQMRGLVESLLQLARVDNGAIQKMQLQRIDFSQLLSDELLTFEALFFEKGLTLTDALTEGIAVHGSEQHLKQVVEILLDNAQKYSDPNGTVHVSLQKKDSHHCILTVSDPGDPIASEDLKKIFQRFYRIDEARAMNHSYGLGLSIAENIVKAHKGRIWAESAEGINSFKVELPLA